MDTRRTFGAWLKMRRRLLDMTQQELADQSSCSVVTIRKIEQGERRPSSQLAELMAEALQVPAALMDEFVTFARLDPDSTQMPPALQELGHSVSLPTVESASVQRSRSRPVERAKTYTLPRPTTHFLGRELEIAAILAYLDDPARRLVSILGPGGMGKTRLALAVADRLAAHADNPFVDGMVFVSLAALTERTQIAPAIADTMAIAIDARRDTKEQLLAYLLPRRFLLIADNCEHLLDGIDLLAEIVQAAPGVTVLATSRERLHLQGEQAFPIDGLGMLDPIDIKSGDAMAHPAVQLLQQTAQRAVPAYVLTVDDLPHVARICHLVSGMPLGIELAAGWVSMMSLAEIIGEVQRNLDFLSSDLRDLPARHRSMHAVFDASWQHLDPIDRSIFSQISVFRGGFTRHAAAAVAHAALRQLGHLIHKSLLNYDQTHNRYWLHELLQQYGAAKLAEDAAAASTARTRHCDYFVGRLIACWELLRGEDQAGALAELDADIDNFRLAWRTAIAHGVVTRLRMAMDTLGFYFEWRFHPNEGRAAFQRLADAADSDESDSDETRATLIRALTWQAAFLRQLGKPDAAIALLDRAEMLCDHPAIDPTTQQFEQAFIAYQRGYCLERRQNERALACFRKSVELWEAYGDPWWVALGLGGLGYALSWSNYFIEAREQLSHSVEIFEGFGHARELVFLHNRLYDSCEFKGDLEAARRHGERALALAQHTGNRKGQADATRNLADLAILNGNLDDASTLNRDVLERYRALGVQLEAALAIVTSGQLCLIQEDVEGGIHRFMEAMDIFKRQQLRQGEGLIWRWLAIAAVMDDRHAEAKEKIERSIEIFTEVHADNYIPHLQIIRFLIDKESLPPAQAKPWLAGLLRHALEIREFFDVYWALSAIAYVLLVNATPENGGQLPQQVSLAAEMRGFVGESLGYGRSAYMCALVHDEVDCMLARWPQQEISDAKASGRQQEVWEFAEAVLVALTEREADKHEDA